MFLSCLVQVWFWAIMNKSGPNKNKATMNRWTNIFLCSEKRRIPTCPSRQRTEIESLQFQVSRIPQLCLWVFNCFSYFNLFKILGHFFCYPFTCSWSVLLYFVYSVYIWCFSLIVVSMVAFRFNFSGCVQRFDLFHEN